MKKTLALALAAGVLATALAGCSDDGDTPDEETSSSAAGEATEAVDPANVSPSDLPDIPALKRERGGAIKDLDLGECATDKGDQEVTGSITSTLKRKADYLVTVSWTTSSGDVMGRGFALLKNVAPGATQDFTIDAKVADGATQCVPGVVYGKS